MPRDKSNLFFMANITAPACSATLPIIGMIIAEIKIVDNPKLSDVPLIVDTTKSDRNDMNNVTIPSHNIAFQNPNTSSSSSSSSMSDVIVLLDRDAVERDEEPSVGDIGFFTDTRCCISMSDCLLP